VEPLEDLISKLTPSQREAVEGTVEAYYEGSRVVGIQGAAGFGKTFCLKTLLLRLGLLSSTVFTAPTHEACKQLALDLPKKSDVQTIYKLAGMRVTDSGEEQFAVAASALSLAKYKVVVIDEVSMCGDGLYKRFQEMRSLFPDILFILVGDRYQLRPPKNPISSFFQEYLTNPSFELRESMRMHKDSPVLSTALELRELIDEGYRGTIEFQPERSEHGNIYVTGLKKFNESFARAVSSAEYTPHNIVAIAYTNVRVRQLNALARRGLHGVDCPDWLEGEEVTLLSPLQRDGFTEVNTNATGIIRVIGDSEYSQQAMDIMPEHPIKCWSLHVDFDGMTYVCLVPNEEGVKAYETALSVLRATARSSGSSYDWRKYHQFRLSVANLRHTYAITAHKSQGKSYNHTVYVDCVDIQNPKHRAPDMINLLNVAITRSRKDVVIAQR